MRLRPRVFAMAVLVCVFAASANPAQSTQSGNGDKNRHVSQAERAEAIDTLVKNLESDYILPDVAKKMAQVIREHQARHEYDANY
jgi:hypothetical protein